MPLSGGTSRRYDREGRLTPRNKEPPNLGRGKVLSIASSEELEFDYTSSSQSPTSTHQRIDTDIDWMDIDLCAFGPRHNIDLQPWHIWYRHRCLSTRQCSHLVKRLHFRRTILVGTGTIAGVHVVPGVTTGSKRAPGFGIHLSLMSRPRPSLSVSLAFSCRMNPSLSSRPSEPPLAAILLEQCRQRSLDFEDQYDG